MPSNAVTNLAVSLGATAAYQFDEASGSLVDQVGSNDATASGTPAYRQNGVAGSSFAVGFDGSTDYFTSGSNILNGATSYTIEAVVATDDTALLQVIGGERDSSTSGGALLHAATAEWRFRHNSSNIAGGASVAGEYAHIAGVWDGATVRLYVNGEEVASASDSSGVSTVEEFRVGAREYSGLSQFLDGSVAHLAVYKNTVLSQSDIRSLHFAAFPPKLTYQADLSASAVSALISDGVVDFGTHSLTSAQNSAVFSTSTSSTGADVWFSSDEDGSTPIAADIYYWDDASSVFKAKVAAGALSSVTGGTIYLHVGNKPGGVSGDPYPATVEGVYPLADSLNDQSSNGNNLTASGGLTVGSGGSGPDGNMPSTDFTSASSQVAYAAISGGGAATVSGWFNSDTDSTRALFSWANFASNSNYLTARAAGSSSGDPVDAASRNTTLNNVETTTGYTVGTWHHFAMKIDSSGNLDVFIDGGSKGSASGQALTAGLDNFEIGALGRSSTHAESAVFDGELAMFRADSTDRSDAEINLDYLLEGPNASTYWTVTNLTTLPDFTFELRSDREVVLSGTDVTSWGNASGGTSPSYSADAADKVLGFPAIQFDSGSSEYLEWDEIASVAEGVNSEHTIVALLKPEDLPGSAVFLSFHNTATNEYEELYLNLNEDLRVRVNDGTNLVNGAVTTGNPTPNTGMLVFLKIEDGTMSYLLRSVDGLDEGSRSEDISSVTGSLALDSVHIGAAESSLYFDGSIYRIALVNHALGGDLTGDITGTQMELLLNEMLTTAGGTGLSKLLYGVGLKLGWRL